METRVEAEVERWVWGLKPLVDEEASWSGGLGSMVRGTGKEV